MPAGTWAVSDSRTPSPSPSGTSGTAVHGSVALSWGELRGRRRPARRCGAAAEFDLNSLATGIAKRDADLRKPRFLDIDRIR